MSMQETPRANRIHIGIFGRRNSGKSSLINAITRQSIAVVSPYAGTTTDPVYKAMELHPIGPVVFIDTAGYDDEGELGNLRVEKTKEALLKTDVAILLLEDTLDFTEEIQWITALKERKTPVILVLSKIDLAEGQREERQIHVQNALGDEAIFVSTLTGEGLLELRQKLEAACELVEEKNPVQGLVKTNDLVLLVMPQDIQAPKGRLILPQVQITRALLDEGCLVFSCVLGGYEEALSRMKDSPKLIITDSQCFAKVYETKPKESLLTSFSVLLAAQKGDIAEFVRGAEKIDQLKETSKVLIAEACTHAPLEEDIGRVKLPRLLRQRFGDNLQIDIATGVDFPQNLSEYDLILHCGGCMFNRKYMLSRINDAKKNSVAITNYGVALAKLTGILDKIVY